MPIGEQSDPWKHRNIGMKCETCMWFVIKEKSESVCVPSANKLLGRCRRHAPSMNGYPAAFQDDWCGDHKLDENKL